MKKLLLAATGLGAVALASPASAALILDASVNGGGFSPICSAGQGGACSPGIIDTIGGVTFTVLGASSNSPGTATNADTTQAAVKIDNESGGTVQITLRAGDTLFTQPSGAVTLSNNISGTVITGGADNLFSSFACANPSDAQNSCAGAFTTATINSDITAPGHGSNGNTLAIANLGTPFSLTETVNFTLDNHSVLNYAASADVVPAYEPASLGILGFGVLGLAFVSSRKRVHTADMYS